MANETTTRSDRTRQEQIRKRRHNLFKRIKEFNDRYQIETWLVMRMPSGWIYTFNTNDEKAPTEEELVCNECTNLRIHLLIWFLGREQKASRSKMP